MSEPREATPPPVRATFTRELSVFLVEFSIGFHRFGMYPPGHPSLMPAVQAIIRSLGVLLRERRTLSIGVAHHQLIMEGVATDERHPVLTELARRLHEQQLAALSIDRGVSAEEVSELLGVLARVSGSEETPIGLLPPEEMPRWEHARLYGVGYEQLEIRGETEEPSHPDRAQMLWLGLAQAALGSEPPAGELHDAGLLARRIERHAREAAYDQVIVGYLLQLGEELKASEGGETEKVRQKVSRLVGDLDTSTMSRLLELGGSAAERRRFVLDANESLSVEAVVKILGAASACSGQSISDTMTRLLRKLATHAERGSGTVRAGADVALRENVEAMVAGWTLEDPHPEAYSNVLDEMAAAVPAFEATSEGEGAVAGAERLVEMAVEVEAWGPVVEQAVTDFLAAGGTGRLLEMVREAPDSSEVAGKLRERLVDPSHLTWILAGAQLDPVVLRELIDGMGPAAVGVLLKVLAESDSRTARRRAFDALAEMGPSVLPHMIDRLSDPRWFVQRNMLGVLQRFPELPEHFDVMPYARHHDARVRREAVPLALRDRRWRGRVMRAALGDSDDRVVRLALAELTQEVPDVLLGPLIEQVVLREGLPSDLRVQGVKLLALSPSPAALGALLRVATSGRTLFGKVKLASPSPLLVAAVRALATCWGERPEVRELLAQAARSRDPAVRAAATRSGAGQSGRGA